MTVPDEDVVYIPRDFRFHPVVGAGQSSAALLRPGALSRFEAWLTILFSARQAPADRVYRDKLISLDRGELLVSRWWLSESCRWPQKEAASFLRAIDDGELARARLALPEWPIHGADPFVLRLLVFEAAGGSPRDADGNIGMYLGKQHGRRDFFSALSVYQRAHIPMAVRKAVYERDGYACVKCGSALRLSLDHIIAVTSGGDDSPENLRTLCLPCNVKKGGRNGDAA